MRPVSVKTAGNQTLNYRYGGKTLELVPVNILLVEDFEPFREHVSRMLQKNARFEVIGEVADGLEAVKKATELKPDLILLDLALPTLNGIEVAQQVRHLSPASKILFLTGERAPDVVQAALATGALGYVIKVDAAAELLAAIETVLKGHKFVSLGVGQTRQ
jgi:DNA-binding NarL/FixJ family response regulator